MTASEPIEEGNASVLDTIKFNDAGLIPVVAQSAASGDVLMVAWMNRHALERTLATRRMTYWSRSRSELWVKGMTSGNTQELTEMRIDCDRDCLLALIEPAGPACHTGETSCFHVTLPNISDDAGK